MKSSVHLFLLFLSIALPSCGESEEACNCTTPGLEVVVPKGQVNTILAGDVACQGASIECTDPGTLVGPDCTTYRILPTTTGACNVIADYIDGTQKSKVVGFSYESGCCPGYFTKDAFWDLTQSP